MVLLNNLSNESCKLFYVPFLMPGPGGCRNFVISLKCMRVGVGGTRITVVLVRISVTELSTLGKMNMVSQRPYMTVVDAAELKSVEDDYYMRR